MLLLYAFRDLWKELGDSNFQIFTELPVPPQAARVIGSLNRVLYQSKLCCLYLRVGLLADVVGQ